MHFKILSLYRKESTLPSTWMVTPYYCCSSAALAAPFVFEYFVCSVLLVGYFGWECVCLWAFIRFSHAYIYKNGRHFSPSSRIRPSPWIIHKCVSLVFRGVRKSACRTHLPNNSPRRRKGAWQGWGVRGREIGARTRSKHPAKLGF